MGNLSSCRKDPKGHQKSQNENKVNTNLEQSDKVRKLEMEERKKKREKNMKQNKGLIKYLLMLFRSSQTFS